MDMAIAVIHPIPPAIPTIIPPVESFQTFCDDNNYDKI